VTASRLAPRLRARRTDAREERTYRLANTIRLPFAVGVVGFLVLALGVALLVGRVEESELQVPGAVRELQASVASEVGESIRRGLNEAVDDLTQLAAHLERAEDPAPALSAFAAIHGRYDAVYVLDEGGAVTARAGSVEPDLSLVDGRRIDEAGLHAAFADDGSDATIVMYAPIAGGRGTVVAQYSRAFLQYAMAVATPGDAWLVSDEARVIAGLGGAAVGGRLPLEALDRAAQRAGAGSDGAEVAAGGALTRDVVAWVPVDGVGPAGGQEWGVVTVRRVEAAGLGAPQKRGAAIGFGGALAVATLLLFGWLRAVLVRPILDVQREAERLAYGDLSTPVDTARNDEIGAIARGLERIRVLLIRSRARKG
jgi:HAMP domain-containing protein